MQIGYARVSTQEQDTALQLEALRQAGCSKIFEEKASGAKFDRPVLWQAIDVLKPGDQLVFYKLDRIARSLSDLLPGLCGAKATASASHDRGKSPGWP